VPTTRPRYTVTDTGHVRELLDAAQARWPETSDRKALLMRLAEAGHAALQTGDRQSDERDVRAALARIPALVDRDALLSDAAWR
jgi:hypothetical protein